MKFVPEKTGETPRKTYSDSVSSATKPTWSIRDANLEPQRYSCLMLSEIELRKLTFYFVDDSVECANFDTVTFLAVGAQNAQGLVFDN